MVSSDNVAPFDRTQTALNRAALDNETILSGAFWEELRIFLAVAKTKSYNRAADLLGIAQPTVSRKVERLQRLLGAQLVVSTRQGARLTPRGMEVARVCANLDQFLFSLRNDLQAEAREEAAIVRISITDGLAALFVAPALAAFSTAHPKIQVHVKSPESLVSLRDNATDMMLSFMPTGPSDVTVRQMGSLHFLPFATRHYVEMYGLPTRENLEGHIFLQSELYAARTGVWDRWLALLERGRVAHYCDNSFAYAGLFKAGAGIALLGNYCVMDPALIALDLGVTVSVPMSVAALTERLKSRPVQIVFDWLAQIFGHSNPWFADEILLRGDGGTADAGFRTFFNL
jgi:DNA-binding transcriptional LysR family regulator